MSFLPQNGRGGQSSWAYYPEAPLSINAGGTNVGAIVFSTGYRQRSGGLGAGAGAERRTTSDSGQSSSTPFVRSISSLTTYSMRALDPSHVQRLKASVTAGMVGTREPSGRF